MSGQVSVSWGKNGGFYITRWRICLWRVALTFLPYEVDELMARAFGGDGE